MSKSLVLRWVALPLAAVGVAALFVAAQNVEPSGEAARMEGFSQPDGTNYFAVSLRAAPAPAPGPRDVVILFSSAASQVGGYREKSLEAVQATLAALDPRDRVKIMAYDLHAVSITKDFVAPNSPAVAQAMAGLRQRVPLGAADLEGALMAAASSYRGDSKAARAIVLIGEGTSRANALAPEQFEKLVSSLVAERTPVLSYGIGPRIDQPMLWALAGRTGGMAIEDSAYLTSGKVGGMLTSAAHAPVYWPTGQAKWPEGTEVYPKILPPLRSDRDTVLVGTSKTTAAQKLALSVEGPNGPQALDWDLPAIHSDSANGYLRPVVEQARIDGGVTLPLVDMASLRQAREDLLVGGRNLDQLARSALAANNLDGAEKLVAEALRRDPRDPEATALREALAKRRAAPAAAAGAPPAPADNLPPAGPANDLNLVGTLPAAGAPSGAAEGANVGAESARISAAEQATQMEVTAVINQARAAMGTDPAGALAKLRDKTEQVRQLPEIRPELRDQLLGQLQQAIRAGKARQTEFENHMRQIQEAEAAAKERMLVADSMQRRQQKVRQLMDRFEVLISEGKFKEAEEDTAGEVAKIVDSSMDRVNNPVAVDATLYARTKGAVNDILALRVQKQKGFLDTMFQVEKSHVPMADEPPIIYPPAEVWKELTARRKERYSASEMSHHGAADKKIDEALKSPTTIEFVETPLQDVIDYLKDLHHIEIQLDKKELESMNIGSDTLVTKNLKGISLRSALKLMLDELGLKYVVHNEVLLITSPTKAESEEFLTTKVYPVADLVVPIQTPTMAGGFGGMGGMMGGMGNTMMGGGMGGMMGGGMGGMGGMMGGMGGMGGMMGGMGGMGGGMGGMGGMFNVPIAPVPNLPKQPQQPNGLNAFFVKEEAVPAETPPAPAKKAGAGAETPSAEATKTPPAEIDLKLAPGADATAAWDRYFAGHPKADPVAVRRTAAKLMDGRKFDQVIALIEAALRHQQVQSWMYEGLGLALQAAGRPKDEVERALMSAADLAQGTADLMYLAAYLERLEMDRRALSLYHEVSQLDPLWTEPCLHGLRVAKRLHDADGIQWSAAGILSQAWPVSQAEIFKGAYRTAAATLEDLRSKKRTREADRFEAAINEALARDCIVIVSWTGEADVDLMVTEPAGTVCSLRNCRTTSGGLVQNDVPLGDGAAGAQGHTAMYACPQAFSGAYEAVIRRVWGQVITGKVTVDLYRHYGTPQARCEEQKIALERGEALVKFDLAGGRRKVALSEQQVANAAVAQVVMNQQAQVLAQQIQMLNDPQAQAALARANQVAAAVASQTAAAGQAGGPVVPFPWPYPVQGGVGYMPIIIALPEGANMTATGVVSADRRYVRITCVPLFSAIAKVTTFSMDTGASATQAGGGTNGQGFGGLGLGQGGGGLGGNGGGGVGGGAAGAGFL